LSRASAGVGPWPVEHPGGWVLDRAVAVTGEGIPEPRWELDRCYLREA